MSILANYHTHSVFCDGNSTLEEVAKSAFDCGIKYLGFSSHSAYPATTGCEMHPENFLKYKATIEELKKQYGNRFEFKLGCFGNFAELIEENIDGAVFDIGVSSMQLDQAERGFSFTKDAPLDMRMSQSGVSAKDLVNTLSEQELADILYNFGEEKKSRQIAKKIVEARKSKPIETTLELANIIYQINKRSFNQTIDPATRSFQALRIAVNDELNELNKGLLGASSKLNKGGRLVVVDFHSLEDRIVKAFMKTNSDKREHVSRYRQNTNTTSDALFSFASKAIVPSAQELELNTRSRSAKLRYAIRN